MIAAIGAHTADGVKVELAHREDGVSSFALKRALPAKFEATIKKALCRLSRRLLDYESIEALPQRCEANAVGDKGVGADALGIAKKSEFSLVWYSLIEHGSMGRREICQETANYKEGSAKPCDKAQQIRWLAISEALNPSFLS